MNFGGWRAYNTEGRIHVIPNNDLKTHGGESCWCKPEDNGECIIHNSADGREHYETGERKVS